METYMINETDIVHSKSVDFVTREPLEPIHIVQYDQTQPIIAVKLLSNKKPYILPKDADVNIRFRKPNMQAVIKPAFGCDITRSIVYFKVDDKMSACYGKAWAIIEIKINGTAAGTSILPFMIDRNPIENY